MVVTFGEALVDMIEQPDGRFAAALGGSVCNFTLAVARQGMTASYLNPLSGDTFGQRFGERLREAGVKLASPHPSLQPTSLAVVTLDASKTPSYAFHREGVADRDITPDQARKALPAGMRLFHTGGLALVRADLEATLQVIGAAASAGAVISIDANLRPKVDPDLVAYAAGVRKALALAHVVKVSEEDLQYLGLRHANPVDAALTLFDAPSVRLVALTLGEQGAVLLSREARATQDVPPGIEVVDTVGAGDCFAAGLLACLEQAGKLTVAALEDVDVATLELALRRAIATATLNVMQEGCNPPTRAEVDAFLSASAQ